MRRQTSLLALALSVLVVIAVGCGDDDESRTMADVIIESTSSSSSTSTSAAPTTTTEAPTTTVPATTTVAPASTTTTTTTEPQGMCGDLTPVVTEEGTLCLTPEEIEWGVGVDPFWEGAMPPLVVVQNGGEVVELVETDFGSFDSSSRPSVDGWVVDVRVAIDGSLVVERHDSDEQEYWPEVVILHPDGTETVVPGAVDLYDVTVVDGEEVILVSGIPWGRVDEDDLLEAVAFDDPSRVVFDLGLASSEEFEIFNAAIRGDTAVVSGRDVEGDFVEVRPLRPGGFTGRFAGFADWMEAATLSPDGRVVTWVQAPESETDPEWVAWRLHGIELESDFQDLGWPVEEPDVADTEILVVHSVFDVDDFVIVNRVSWEGEVWTALPAFVIDFTVEEPDTYFLPVAGLAAPAPVVG